MLVVVATCNVGAAGAACEALVTVAVGKELTLPLQLAAVTVTVMVLLISACTKV